MENGMKMITIKKEEPDEMQDKEEYQVIFIKEEDSHEQIDVDQNGTSLEEGDQVNRMWPSDEITNFVTDYDVSGGGLGQEDSAPSGSTEEMDGVNHRIHCNGSYPVKLEADAEGEVSDRDSSSSDDSDDYSDTCHTDHPGQGELNRADHRIHDVYPVKLEAIAEGVVTDCSSISSDDSASFFHSCHMDDPEPAVVHNGKREKTFQRSGWTRANKEQVAGGEIRLHNSREKLHQCSEGKGFISVHKGKALSEFRRENPYQCSEKKSFINVQKVFRQSSHLASHTRTNRTKPSYKSGHRNTGKEPAAAKQNETKTRGKCFPCPVCNKECFNKPSLNYHISRHAFWLVRNRLSGRVNLPEQKGKRMVVEPRKRPSCKSAICSEESHDSSELTELLGKHRTDKLDSCELTKPLRKHRTDNLDSYELTKPLRKHRTDNLDSYELTEPLRKQRTDNLDSSELTEPLGKHRTDNLGRYLPHKHSGCNKEFHKPVKLAGHIGKHRADNLLHVYKCALCREEFCSNIQLAKHSIKCMVQRTSNRKRSDNSKSSDISSIKCGVPQGSILGPFHSKIGLKGRMRKQIASKPFWCRKCNNRFSHFVDLKWHLRSHTEENQVLSPRVNASSSRPVYECDVCGMIFRMPGSLANHMKLHVGEKAYRCSICQAAFFENTDLSEHMKCHLQVEENPFVLLGL